MEGIGNFNDIVTLPLMGYSYRDWFEDVKNYLISKDLWEVTSSGERPDERSVEEFVRWRRNNAKALHVIRISCGARNLPLIREASEAKFAWDILYRAYDINAPPPIPLPPSPPKVMTEAEEMGMAYLYKNIYENNWPAAKEFIDGHPRALNVEFGALIGETPLHVAATFGHVRIVEELVRLVAPEYLEIRDARGDTPLIKAATHSGSIPIAKCLIDKNSNALTISDAEDSWAIPLILSFRHGLKELGHYLYSVTPLDIFKPQNGHLGPTFLKICFGTGNFDIALDLLQRYTELLFTADFKGEPTIVMIASYLPISLNKSQHQFWKKWIYHYIKIPSTTTTTHFYVDIQQQGESNKAHQGLGLLHWLISCIYNLSGIKEICKMKQQHVQAAEILNLVCENVMFINEKKKHMIADAMIFTADEENVEFLLRVTKANPGLISLVTFPQQKGYLFFEAVRYRNAEIFNLLRCFRFKHVVAAKITSGGDTLLHVAAMLAPASYLNRISGAALQMQRELQWFKAVEGVDSGLSLSVNDVGLRPLDFFKETHKELRDKGEKWLKETASSCSVVGALIVTIMFAASFTVPGGNNQTSGYPIFLKERLFKVFLISDTLSLFSSATSVLTFLGILTSRYAEEDFLYSLPTKLIIGLSTLFLSIATMMIAFSVTIIIMLQDNSWRLWAFLPVTMLAGVPVTLFVFLQFPLLVEVISSTYGSGIFKKKVDMWP